MLQVGDLVKVNIEQASWLFNTLVELLNKHHTNMFSVENITDAGFKDSIEGVTDISIAGIYYDIEEVDESLWAFFTLSQYQEHDCFSLVEDEIPSFQCETILDITPTTQMCLRAPERSESDVFKHLIEEVGEFTKTLYRPVECDESAINECADIINTLVDTLWLNYRSKEYFKDVNDTDLMCIMMSELNESIAIKSRKWANCVGVK